MSLKNLRDEGRKHLERAQTRLEEQVARERVGQAHTLAEMQDGIGHLERERDALHQSLVTSQEELTGLQHVQEEEREHLERSRMTAEAERRRLAAESSDVQQTLDQV